MRKIKVKEMTVENFRDYGTFANMLKPQQYKKDGDSLKFFRELVNLDLGHETSAAFSTLQVKKRPMIVDVTEFHTACGEGIFAMDGDIVMHIGPACIGNEPPLGEFEAFLVPKGIMVALRPGVWHYEPFAVDNQIVNTLIILPERTYANDCVLVKIPEDKQFEMEL